MEKIITCPNCHTQFDLSVNPVPTEGSNYLWILDNGHGGMIDGVYQTPGKRSPVWPDGTQLFEGEFNRAIVDRLMVLCEANGIDAIDLVNTPVDISLNERTSTANKIVAIPSDLVSPGEVYTLQPLADSSLKPLACMLTYMQGLSEDLASLFEKAARS